MRVVVVECDKGRSVWSGIGIDVIIEVFGE